MKVDMRQLRNTRDVMVALTRHATSHATTSHRDIAAMCGLSISTVARALDRLEQCGYIEREHQGKQLSRTVRVVIPWYELDDAIKA